MRVPIIAMSANAFAEDIINSQLAGMNAHLAKPLDAEKMIVALKQCMEDNRDIKTPRRFIGIKRQKLRL